LKFDLRRLKTDSIARRVTVRLSPERRLTLVRGEGETGWVETVETIPWAITRLRVTGTIESSLYDALDKAMADSFLPAPERRQLAWTSAADRGGARFSGHRCSSAGSRAGSARGIIPSFTCGGPTKASISRRRTGRRCGPRRTESSPGSGARTAATGT